MRIDAPKILIINFLLILGTFTVVLAGFVGGYLFISALANDRTPAEAAIVKLRSVPPKQALCAGGDLPYIFGVQQLRSPLVARIVKTIVRPETKNRPGKTIVPMSAGDTELRIWKTLKGFEQAETFHIPRVDVDGNPVLPGMYELRVAIVAESAAPSEFALPFRITDCE